MHFSISKIVKGEIVGLLSVNYTPYRAFLQTRLKISMVTCFKITIKNLPGVIVLTPISLIIIKR